MQEICEHLRLNVKIKTFLALGGFISSGFSASLKVHNCEINICVFANKIHSNADMNLESSIVYCIYDLDFDYFSLFFLTDFWKELEVNVS